MKNYAGPFPRLVSVLVLTLSAAAAQSTSPSGSFGFLINSSFSLSSANATGMAVLGVMNFDGAGNVTGPYTYELDVVGPTAMKTTAGTFTGTYSSNPDGTGSMTMSLDAGIVLTLAMVIADGGQSLQLSAVNFQFPAANCACLLDGIALSGIARAKPAGSLNGSYGYQTSNTPLAGGTIGVEKFDGAGNVTLSAAFIGAADSKGQAPSVIGGTQNGTYSVDPDGRGTIDFPAVAGVSNHQTYAFVVTNGGSGLLLIQTDRAGSGVSYGIGRLQ